MVLIWRCYVMKIGSCKNMVLDFGLWVCAIIFGVIIQRLFRDNTYNRQTNQYFWVIWNGYDLTELCYENWFVQEHGIGLWSMGLRHEFFRGRESSSNIYYPCWARLYFSTAARLSVQIMDFS